jgi:hypothetical protein
MLHTKWNVVFKAAIQRQGSIWACKLIIYNVEIIACKLDLFKNPIMFMYLYVLPLYGGYISV